MCKRHTMFKNGSEKLKQAIQCGIQYKKENCFTLTDTDKIPTHNFWDLHKYFVR